MNSILTNQGVMNLFYRMILTMGSFLALTEESAVVVEEFASLDSGDTAWMLTSTVLVLLMCIPGLIFFYGGLVRSKNVLSVMVQCFAMCGIMTILWVGFGYAVASGDSLGGGTFGWDSAKVLLGHIEKDDALLSGTIPESVFVIFQMTFIIISPALIVGAFAERMKFSAMLVFTIVWTILSYLPMWHMAWGGGLFHTWEAIDFAGGNVVHINAGIAGLVACIAVGKRKGFPGPSLVPHNVPFVLLGAALLWVGWFGFNAGSACAADTSAGMAMLTTQIAAGVAVVVWMVLEMMIHKKPTAVGVATGAVAGLVAITPAAGTSTIAGAMIIGAISSVVCFIFATKVKNKLKYDDSLDVFGVHGMGGIVGALLTGVFIRESAGVEGGIGQFGIQLKSVIVTVVWSGIVSVIAIVLAKVLCGGIRVSEDVENAGLDLKEHGEEAYNRES